MGLAGGILCPAGLFFLADSQFLAIAHPDLVGLQDLTFFAQLSVPDVSLLLP